MSFKKGSAEHTVIAVLAVVLLVIMFAGLFNITSDFYPNFVNSASLPGMFQGDAWAFMLFGCIMALVVIGGFVYLLKDKWGV